MTIKIIEQTLSDGSKVYNLVLFGQGILPAVTFSDACECAEKIQAAIRDYTNAEPVKIIWALEF